MVGGTRTAGRNRLPATAAALASCLVLGGSFLISPAASRTRQTDLPKHLSRPTVSLHSPNDGRGGVCQRHPDSPLYRAGTAPTGLPVQRADHCASCPSG